MSVAIPRERCYYYECSDGRVRLTYFIPPNELDDMVAAGQISPAVREDFPDGVDLDCTEPDFADFHAEYGYRPDHDPEALQNAFYAIFTSTRGWRTYRGSGLIPAEELESRIPEVDRSVREAVPEAPAVLGEPVPGAPAVRRGVVPGAPAVPRDIVPEAAAVRRDPRNLEERRRRRRAAARTQSRVEHALRELDVEGVRGDKPIDEQPFRQPRMSRGKRAHEVFALLQRRQQREP